MFSLLYLTTRSPESLPCFALSSVMQDLMSSSSVPGNIPDSFLTSCSCLADLLGGCWGSLVSLETGGGPGGRPGGGPGGGRLKRGGKELEGSPRGGGGTDSSRDIEVSPEHEVTVRLSHGVVSVVMDLTEVFQREMTVFSVQSM